MAFEPAIDTINSLVTLDDAKAFLSVSPDPSVPEITDITCEADVGSSLNNKYFLINSPTVLYYVWFNVATAGTDPALVGRTGIEVAIIEGETAANVASKAAIAIALLVAVFTTTALAAVITLTNVVAGTATDATNGNTTWSTDPDVTQDGTDVTDEEYLINFYINSASWFCNNHTKRLLKSRALTEYYNGDNTDTVIMNNWPITVITKLYDDLARAYGADTEVTLASLVYLPERLANLIVYDGGIFLKGLKNLKVEYTAGYTVIPWELQQACLEIVAFFWYNTEENRSNVKSRSVGDGSVVLVETTDLPKSTLRILDSYKRKW